MSLAPSPSDTGLPPHLHVRLDGKVPILQIPPMPSFEELRSWLREVLPEQAEVVGGRASRLDLADREIKLFDLRRLIHFLREEHGIEITGLYVRPEVIHRFAERELKLKLFPTEPTVERPSVDPEPAAVDPADVPTLVEVPAPSEAEDEATAEEAPVVEPEVAKLQDATLPHDLEPEDLEPDAKVEKREDGRRTLTLRRTLRSGAIVRFDGDVYVFGDVNPGGQVVATGNIVVLGALKGQAHAGAAGAEDSFILAFQLRPTQLRIARKIAIAPERGDTAAFHPEMATIVDGQIVLEPYKGRIR